MAIITRANPYLNEILEILDVHLEKHHGDVSKANEYLNKDDREWIDQELLHCMTDSRYFISNYFAYRDEKEGFKGLYPFFDSQEILYEEYRKLRTKHGNVRAMVLKARQMGITTYNMAEVFANTIFTEHINALLVAQDEGQSNYMYGMYRSALDYLPWWMRPRIKSMREGDLLEFDEKDDRVRQSRPGLKTWIYADNARKPTGVGRGKTFARAHLSELAFWANPTQLSKSLFPTMNTPDGFYIMESTANGRNDFWHNLWRKAEAGKIPWHPIFIPFYRRAVTYSVPIEKGEVFILTAEEKEMRERIEAKEGFHVTDETFKWVRQKKEEYQAIDDNDNMFSQEYTASPEESFQTAAVTAFPRKTLNMLSRRTRNPLWVGEIYWDSKTASVKLVGKTLTEADDISYPEMEGDRFSIFEKPIKGDEYGLGCDVALGNPGGDYSCVQVIKKGRGHAPDQQVACWHGLIAPTALAGVVCAIGTFYNEALAAVEVNSFGIQTNYDLMHNYEYENIYRFKRLDHLKGNVTNITGFLSTSKSTDGLMARMSEYLLDDNLDIPCKYTVDEFMDYTETGADGDGAHDDMVDALLIALYCLHEAEVTDRQEGRKKDQQQNLNTFRVKDRFGTIILETTSQVEAKRLSDRTPGSQIERESGAAAFIAIRGQKLPVPADFQNTAFSPVHDKQGTAHRLHYEEDVPEEMITPEMIAQFEDEQETSDTSDPDAWRWT
jgi:hypothetical protein